MRLRGSVDGVDVDVLAAEDVDSNYDDDPDGGQNDR
jgi:hypothetical protein